MYFLKMGCHYTFTFYIENFWLTKVANFLKSINYFKMFKLYPILYCITFLSKLMAAINGKIVYFL